MVGMTMRAFNYIGEPLTCLWCGRKFRQHPDVRYDRDRIPVVGAVVRMWGRERTVAKVEPRLRRASTDANGYHQKSRRAVVAKPGETPEEWWVYYDPPLWDSVNAYGNAPPLFDIGGCAERFGTRAAELGYRLHKREAQEEVTDREE